MPLLNEPIIKKFFSNKIESSLDDWGDYLLEIANIFSMFDGEDYDRGLLSDYFQTISGRSPYVLRDQSNFRDEFGAYGTYLGVYHVEKINNKWQIMLTEAAKQFLCTPEPNIQAFCRAQLALFQYPNGAGCVIEGNGARIQANVMSDTVRELENNIRLSPFRFICRLVVALHQINNVELNAIKIPYDILFALVNDSRLNTIYNPGYPALVNAYMKYQNTHNMPAWATSGITNFKRNFHILEKTGLFIRYNKGLKINPYDIDGNFQIINEIAGVTLSFNEFESYYGSNYNDDAVKGIIKGQSWGKYYDAANLPLNTLSIITGLNISEGLAQAIGIRETEKSYDIVPENVVFPALHDFGERQQSVRTNVTGTVIDYQAALIKREKANRDHTRILNMIAANLRANNLSPQENVFIDLFVKTEGRSFLFEVKSVNKSNYISQIRKGLSQLYEYRYRTGLSNSILCLVLQEKPPAQWVIDYLVQDRDINVCWLLSDLLFDCPESCRDIFSILGLLTT